MWHSFPLLLRGLVVTWHDLLNFYVTGFKQKQTFKIMGRLIFKFPSWYLNFNPYPTAFPYGNGMVLHFYEQQESSMTKTVHKVINRGLKAYE